MNLDSLESRLDDLINGQKNADVTKNLACDISLLSDGSMPHSCEISHSMDLSSTDSSYRTLSTSTSNGDCAVASPDLLGICTNNGPVSCSLLGGGSITSRR